MEPEEKVPHFALHYEDVADFVFERLTDLGYAPESDELLDVTDLAIDLILLVHQRTGGEVVLMDDEELEDDEDAAI